MSWTPEKTQETLEAVAKRATTDAAFRALALADPAGAVQAVAGEAPPAGYTLRFVDNAKASLTVVLPDLEAADGELADEDLEKVAGGKMNPRTSSSLRLTPTMCTC